MAAKFTLETATFATTPAINQTATVIYRLASDPDVPASYTTVTTTAPITPAGAFTPPVVITGLLNGTAYVVRAINNCNASQADIPFTTPLPNCVNLVSITGTAEDE